MTPVERPLNLGEVIAETVRVYGDRFRPAIALGVVYAVVYVTVGYVPDVVAIPLLAVAITAAWAAATRLVVGDGLGEAWGQVALRAPALLVFTLVASLPFALAVTQLVLIVFAVAWLALTGFAIPVAVAERPEADGRGLFQRLGFGLQRSIELARAEYFHAVGVIAALVIAYVVFGVLLGGLLVGFAENSGPAAGALVQVVLAPFFFLGLAVLYFDQRARAVSSRGRR